MSKITVEAINSVTNYHFGGDSAEVRIYTLQGFTTANVQIIPQGNPISGLSWYLSVPCTIDGGNTLYVPTFEIDSSVDSPTNPNARYAAFLFAEDGSYIGPFPNEQLGPSFSIPAINGNGGVNFTWLEIQIFNLGNPLLFPPSTYYTAAQVMIYVESKLGDLNRASDTRQGITLLDVAPEDPSAPVAVGVNSPLVPREVSGGGDVLVAGQPTTVYSAVVMSTSMIIVVPIADTIIGHLKAINKVDNDRFDVVSDEGGDHGAFGWLIY